MNKNDKRSPPTITKESVGNYHGNLVSKKSLIEVNPNDQESGKISITQSKPKTEFDINDIVKGQQVKKNVAEKNEKQTSGKQNIELMF
ncbi:hypothetical protein AYI70_g6196 [Smittium culicis]|uniref:Uncharacterized protein n=1 Tax=Smittium culicis TaxID=133412 RepID=A0A1R1XR58_9FUNG|nr:hypothetical protein AYI70_g6196 [Smittium culicis]